MFMENSKDLAQNKLLLLYILEQVDIPMSNSELTQFVLENNYMNYFMVQQYLGELVNSRFIEFISENGIEYYKLTDSGKSALNYFTERIPDTTKEEINKKYEKKREELVKETQIIGNYYKKNESEYIVTLKVIEKDITLFNLSLNVVSNKQAKIICQNWKDNPQYVYENILDLLIKNQDN